MYALRGDSKPQTMAEKYFASRYGVPMINRPEDLPQTGTVLWSIHSFRDAYKVAAMSHLKGDAEWVTGGNAATNPTGVAWIMDRIFLGDAWAEFGQILAGDRSHPSLYNPSDPGPVPLNEEPIPDHPVAPGVVMMSVGCPRRCLFCVNAFRRPYEEQDQQVILDYVRGSARKGIDLISNSSSDVSYYEDITRTLADAGKTDTGISMAMAATSDEVIAARKREMLWGIEGMSQRMRKLMNKPIKRALLRERLIRALQLGKQVRTVYQFNFPTETVEDWEEFLGDVEHVREACDSGYWAIPFIPHQPTAMTPTQWLRPQYSLDMVERIMAFRKSMFGSKENGVGVYVPAPLYPRGWFQQVLSEWLPITPALAAAAQALPHKAPIPELVSRMDDAGFDVSHIFDSDKPKDYAFPWDHIQPWMDRDRLWHFAKRLRKGGAVAG